jgi:hypothetical protein
MGESLAKLYELGAPPLVAMLLFHHVIKKYKSTGERQDEMAKMIAKIVTVVKQVNGQTNPTMSLASWKDSLQTGSCDVVLTGGYATNKAYGVFEGC